MPPVSLLIKPSSSNCNLQCEYCFYHNVSINRTTSSYGLMNTDVVDTLVRKALDFADDLCTFAFQGGEPTLVGLDFYKTFIQLEKKYNYKKVNIHYAIQTNGILIDEEWARFLRENNFLVGISLDGPKEIHDGHRKDGKKTGTFKRVMETIRILNKHQVEYNILTVITANVARHITQVYYFFKKNNFRYLQFIPCLDPLNEELGQAAFSLTPERYAYFLKTLFDLWYKDIVQGNMISVRLFDNLVGMVAGYRAEACGMSGSCQCQFVVEADGSVYPCDFYVLDRYNLGNIMDKDLQELPGSEKAQRFISESRDVDEACKVCKWGTLCFGGCRRNREPFVDGKPGLNYYCTAFKEFYEYTFPRMQQLASQLPHR